jgi:aminobenzoyl-glutamate transport protein
MAVKTRRSFVDHLLNFVEKAGNALPHPATLFGLFALISLFMSAVAVWLGWSAEHPGTGEIVHPVNLLSREGLHRVLLERVDNFTGFAPLGIVLVPKLGIAVIWFPTVCWLCCA